MNREEMMDVASRLRKEGDAVVVTTRAELKRRDDLWFAARVIRANADTVEWIEEARPTMCHRASPEDFYPWNDILGKLRVEL